MVTIVAAVTAVGVTGCADRPNDLDTYYDDPASEDPPADGGDSTAPTTTAAPRTSEQAPTVDAAALGRAVGSARLTPADVAEEGVQPAPAADALPGDPGCAARIPSGEGKPREQGRWTYPTGSLLEQVVTGYPGQRAADVLATRVHCAGDPVDAAQLPAAAALDGQRAACEGTTCTVLLASGNVLSAVQVTAGERPRAIEALRRLTPVAAQRLTSASIP